MWPFTKKLPVEIKDLDLSQVNIDLTCKPEKTVEELTKELCDVKGALDQLETEIRMAKFLQATGRYNVTPSGTPVGLISRITDSVVNASVAVAETATDTFHVTRGVKRKIGQEISDHVTHPIKDKINELKELGA